MNQIPNNVVGSQIKAIVERIERLQEDIDGLNGDKKEVYAEAKANGFDTATIKRIVQLRRKPTEERQEADALLELYMSAIGME